MRTLNERLRDRFLPEKLGPTTLVLGVLIVVGVLFIFLGISLKRFVDSRRKRSWSREKVELRYDRLHELKLPVVGREKMLKKIRASNVEDDDAAASATASAADCESESKKSRKKAKERHDSPSSVGNQHPQFKDIYMREHQQQQPHQQQQQHQQQQRHQHQHQQYQWQQQQQQKLS